MFIALAPLFESKLRRSEMYMCSYGTLEILGPTASYKYLAPNGAEDRLVLRINSSDSIMRACRH